MSKFYRTPAKDIIIFGNKAPGNFFIIGKIVYHKDADLPIVFSKSVANKNGNVYYINKNYEEIDINKLNSEVKIEILKNLLV